MGLLLIFITLIFDTYPLHCVINVFVVTVIITCNQYTKQWERGTNLAWYLRDLWFVSTMQDWQQNSFCWMLPIS